jgi:hypothetical protein
MNRSKFLNFTSIFSILLVFSAIPAFANRGGGGGGGFHGGGGFRSGGGGFNGGSSRGGGFRGGSGSAPRMGAGFSRPAQSAPMRPVGGSFARPGSGNAIHSNVNPGNANTHGGVIYSAPAAVADGRWHSFGSAPGIREGFGAAAQAQAPSGAGSGFRVSPGNRSVQGGQSVRSFSGQGNQVWENASAPRNVVSSSRALSNIRASFGNSRTGASGLRSGSALSANSRLANGSVFGNRVSAGGLGANHAAVFGNRLPFGNSRFGFRRGNRWGCWNCGFRGGFGFGWWPGWGFGWPWLGYSFWDPFYWDSVMWGWPGYGYYGDPAGYPYGNNDNSYNDSSSYATPGDNFVSTDATHSTPPEQDAAQVNADSVRVPVLFFLKNGSVFSVIDYWSSGDQIHYILTNGRPGTFDADQLDLQRTTNENAKSGVQFDLRSGTNNRVVEPENSPSPQD